MKLPKIVEQYIKASNDNDPRAFIACFNETATVLDEGQIRKGHKDIADWFAKTKKKYQQTTEPISATENGKEILLRAKVTGAFKGSPVELDYSIEIKSGLIQDIRIR